MKSEQMRLIEEADFNYSEPNPGGASSVNATKRGINLPPGMSLHGSVP
jgi:hypothetical protein